MDEDSTPDVALEGEWIRQNRLMHGALIGIGLIMVQPFIAGSSYGLAGKICIISFAVAIPLLGALILVNQQEMFRGRRTTSRLVSIGKSVGEASGFAGVVAGFWHITWIAGVVMLASGLVATGVHSAGYYKLEHVDPSKSEQSIPKRSDD